MTRFALSFLLESLAVSAMIAIFLIVGALGSKMLRAELRYAVWVVLLFGLLIPMNLIFNGGLIHVPLYAESGAQYAASESLFSSAPIEMYPQEMTAGDAINISSEWVVSPFAICVLIWVIGAAIFFVYQLSRYFRFVHMIRRWGELASDGILLSVFHSVKENIGVKNEKIEIRICELVSTPLLTGFLRPMIVLPKKHFEIDELELIFRHELIHYKRRDLFIKLLSVIAVSIHWFNPVVHLMISAINTDSEASCDEIILRDVKENDRQFYAELMIKMIGNKAAMKTMLSTSYYGGKQSVKRRLDSILDTAKKLKKPAYAVSVAITILTVFSVSAFAFSVQDAQIQPTESPNSVQGVWDVDLEQAMEAAVSMVGGGEIGRYEIVYDMSGSIYHYKIIIVHDGVMYDVDVDGFDGTVKKVERRPVILVDENVGDIAGIIGVNRANALAIESAGGGVVTECRLENKPRENVLVYHVHVAREQYEYCVELDAHTGDVYSVDPRYKP